MDTESKENNRNREKDGNIFMRYFIVTLVLSLVAIAILISAFKIAVTEREGWLKLGSTFNLPDKQIDPTRGNIYSSDDRIMAASMPQYELFIDFGSEGFWAAGTNEMKKDGFALDSFYHAKRNNVDSLAYHLSKKLKNRTQAGYRSHLEKGLKKKDRHYKIYEGKVSYEDLKEIRKFPFLRMNRSSSFFATDISMKRQRPFGTLASRTIGDIYGTVGDIKGQDNTMKGVTKGRLGLELQYDSLLRGVPGIGSMHRVGWHWADVVEVEPVDGMDIRSTLDINIQDLVEKALLDKLKEIDAEVGTAVVMEVKTGEIKAITNMGRISPGRYAETMNHAVADVIEPGSTFKVASMMVAIEDGVAQPNTPVDVGDGNYMYANRRMTDHNNNRGGYGAITAEKAIWYSSNIGVAKIILHGYEKNPKKFVDGLHRIGMDADLKLEIPGAGKARLRHPGDKYWSKTSLPWMSFGYESQIPPIQTLTFFNAIANNGKMVRPMFVKDVLKKGEVVKHFDTEAIIPSICSERTLKIIQNMLYNVVNYKDPAGKRDGTGKPAKSDVITIAGKTGTAQISSGGRYGAGHNVSFCGFFPYENPQYTCIVVISRPRIGVVSGGSMCGAVVKEIAEKIYAYRTVFDVKTVAADSLRNPVPEVLNGDYVSLNNVAKKLNIELAAKGKVDTKYVVAREEKNKVSLNEMAMSAGLVPNVVGMGAKDAVFALEDCGLRVAVSGRGVVESQSIRGGAKIVQGQTVALTLR
jgi:cell division protein FtsI (penicillin-binding protein 3)